jgi:hypothetical protein
MALPIASEIDVRLVLGDKANDRTELLAVAQAAVVVAPADSEA